jgi:hypothetical protein
MKELNSLYEITANLAELMESDGDVSAELDALLPTLEHKAAAVAHFVTMQEDLAQVLKAREDAIKTQRKALESRAERSKAYLLECCQRAEILKLTDSRTGTEIALKKNPPKVIVDDPERVPNQFWRQPDPPPPALDMKALAVALKNQHPTDVQIEGAHLETGWRVEIKA